MDTTTAPLAVTVVIGSNRHGRFGPVVADWLLTHVRDHPELTLQVVDVAETGHLPTSLAPTPEATAALADITPKLAARTPSSSSPPSTTTPTRPASRT